MICPALPNELTAQFARLPEASPPDFDLTEQGLPALAGRYVRLIGHENKLRGRYNLARRAPDEIEILYQKLRALHPVECGGLGEREE